MPVEIITVRCCAQNYALFVVTGSKGDTYYVNTAYEVIQCSCPGWKYTNNCKHCTYIEKNACMRNPQWNEGGNCTVFPTEYDDFTPGFSREDVCEKCKGPTVLVKIAV